MKIILISLIISTNVFALYGEDNRRELYQIKDKKIRELSKAMAYQVERHYELRGWTFNRYWTILTRPFIDNGICSTEAYINQPSMRNNCTGVLIAPKLILTAGNCITDHYCKNDLYYWMFDYNLKSAKSFDDKRSRKNFYLCKRLLKRVYDPSTARSFAVIELKKAVKGIKPVELSSREDLNNGDKLITMGHLRGLPLKVDNGGSVSNMESDYFFTNSDISGSTLGSALFNARTYKLEGLMVHGTRSHIKQGKDCKEEQILDDSDPSEFAIRTYPFKKFLP
jgi:V8-like Glu-specific endopeptidase